MKKEIIIFCQAPSDIQYFLTLYEKHKNENLISVYVINVENIYNFILSLNLDLYKCIFIPYQNISFKNPLNLISERKRINVLISNNFEKIKNSNIYFFSIYEDWLTAAFVKFLSRNNLIYYIDYYDFSADIFTKRKLTLKLKLQKICYKFVTGTSFNFQILEKIPEFDYLKYNIIRITIKLDKTVFERYEYSFIKTIGSKNVIFFISPCENSIFIDSNYDDTQFKIINEFKLSGWNIFIKGHPRIGIPENILKIGVEEVPSYVPAEFLNLDDFKKIFGIITSSLAHFALNSDIQTYSLINLFQYKEEEYKLVYIQYLVRLSNNKIRIIETYDHLLKIIND